MRIARQKRPFLGIALTAFLAGFHAPARPADSASLEYGSGSRAESLAVGLQWQSARRWRPSNGTHVGLRWDLALARWHEGQYLDIPGHTSSLTALGITPAFRFERDTLQGPYAEAGIGLYYLSARYDNDGKRLATRFEFGDRIGIGYVFRNGLDAGLSLRHFSNAGIKRPNGGMNFMTLHIGMKF